MIGCSTIAFTPAPMWQVLLLGNHALAGVILGQAGGHCRAVAVAYPLSA